MQEEILKKLEKIENKQIETHAQTAVIKEQLTQIIKHNADQEIRIRGIEAFKNRVYGWALAIGSGAGAGAGYISSFFDKH